MNISTRGKRARTAAFATASTLALLAGQPALADTTPLAPEILVTAGAEPVPTKDVSSSYTIITAQDIAAHQYQTLPQALATVPGLTVVQSGGTGAVTSVFMRGTNSNQTLVLLNGNPATDPSTAAGAFNLANFTLDNVERIEIVRGPQSALYGSQAIGGVINIITKKGSGAPTSTLRVEAGTLGTLNTGITSGGSVGKTNYFFSLARQATDGNDITPSRLRNGIPEEKDGNENVTASGRLDTEFNENLTASLFGQYGNNRSDTDEGGFDPLFNPVYEDFANRTRVQEVYLSGNVAGRFADGRWRPKLTVAYNRSNSNVVDYDDTYLPNYSENVNNRGDRLNVALDNAFDVTTTNTLTAGGTYTREEFSSNGFQDFGGGFVITPDSNAKTHAFAVSASDRQTFGERLFATVSARYDMPAGFEHVFTYSVAPGYYIPESDTRLTASYSTGFKTPSLFQRFGFSPNSFNVFRGNPDLKPEKSRGWEAGVEQGFFDGAANAGATWFETRVEDPVVVIFLGGGDSTTTNSSSFDTHGIEAFLSASPFEHVTARIDYTYTVLDTDTRSSTLTRRPRHQVGLETTWTPIDALSLTGSAQWVDPYLDIPRDDLTGTLYTMPPSYLVVGISARYTIIKGLDVTARVTNLLNRQYEPANGFQAPGVEALAGIAYTF